MLDALFWVTVGLLIGWNFLPQPVWVANVMAKTKEPVNALVEKVLVMLRLRSPSVPPPESETK